MNPITLIFDIISIFIIIIVLLIITLIVYFTFFSEERIDQAICGKNNQFLDNLCTIYNLVFNFGGTPSGAICTTDYNCNGWWVFGTTACCQNHCVQKDITFEPCPVYCALHPSACSSNVTGNITEISVLGSQVCPQGQHLCHNFCISEEMSCQEYCQQFPQECNRGPHHMICSDDQNCQEGQTCCMGHCVSKESPSQTCDNYCSRHPGICGIH